MYLNLGLYTYRGGLGDNTNFYIIQATVGSQSGHLPGSTSHIEKPFNKAFQLNKQLSWDPSGTFIYKVGVNGNEEIPGEVTLLIEGFKVELLWNPTLLYYTGVNLPMATFLETTYVDGDKIKGYLRIKVTATFMQLVDASLNQLVDATGDSLIT